MKRGVFTSLSPIEVLLLVLVIAGLVLRFANLEITKGFLFDEHHFVENARGYLKGVRDWNDHPPLGKLMIASFIKLLGDRPLAWRLPSLLAGLSTIALGYSIARRLFESDRAGLVAAALLGADGFFAVYSKSAVLDGPLTAFSLLVFWLLLGRLTFGRAVAVGLALGLALSVKISAVALALPILFFCLLDGGKLRRFAQALPLLATIVGVGLVVHYGVWALGLSMHGAYRPLMPLAETVRLYEHHAGLTKMDNPWVSTWTSWFVGMGKPLPLYSGTSGGYRLVLSSLGNPAIWLAVTLSVFVFLATTLWFGVRGILDGSAGAKLFARGEALPLFLGYLGYLLPWILTRRDSYVYHYLPAYGFGILILAGQLDAWFAAARRWVLGYFCVVVVTLGFYVPIWAPLPLRPSGVDARIFLEGWRR